MNKVSPPHAFHSRSADIDDWIADTAGSFDGWSCEWRPGHRVIPLFEGLETFSALETAIHEAKETVHMAYWVLDPTMETVTGDADDQSQRWGELIEETVKRQVAVRVILADFDPVVAFHHHQETYAAYRRLVEINSRLSGAQLGLLQVVTSRHPARIGLAVELIGRYITLGRLNKIVAKLNSTLQQSGEAAALAMFGLLPGLWDRIHYAEGRFSASQRHIPVYLGTHHEKTCIIDGRTVFLGGLDVEQKRYDTPAHDSREPWHDIACRLEGPVSATFERRFRQRWNQELEWFHSFAASLSPPDAVAPLPITAGLAAFDDICGPTVNEAGNVEVMSLQTRSESRRGWFHRTANPVDTDIADFYRDAISAACSFIYIETQYFRMPNLARLIIERAREAPQLRVIILLPLVPDVVAENGKPDLASQHGQYLQDQAIAQLRSAMGAACGVFTLIRNGPAPANARPEAILHGSDLVYVHAKTAIFDDKLAIIGSANLNGRSFWCDTETAIAWRGGSIVRDYRLELWKRLFCCEVHEWSPEQFAQRWSQIAEQNSRAEPGRRQGFVVPLPQERLSLYSRWHWIVPDVGV